MTQATDALLVVAGVAGLRETPEGEMRFAFGFHCLVTAPTSASSVTRAVVLVAMLVPLVPARALAQADRCAFETCLRVTHPFLSGQLAEGRPENAVGTSAVFAPTVPGLAQWSDAAAYHTAFLSTSKTNNTSTWLMVGGLAALTASYLFSTSSDNGTPAAISLTLSLGLFTGALVTGPVTQDRLSPAEWFWYYLLLVDSS